MNRLRDFSIPVVEPRTVGILKVTGSNVKVTEDIFESFQFSRTN